MFRPVELNTLNEIKFETTVKTNLKNEKCLEIYGIIKSTDKIKRFVCSSSCTIIDVQNVLRYLSKDRFQK